MYPLRTSCRWSRTSSGRPGRAATRCASSPARCGSPRPRGRQATRGAHSGSAMPRRGRSTSCPWSRSATRSSHASSCAARAGCRSVRSRSRPISMPMRRCLPQTEKRRYWALRARSSSATATSTRRPKCGASKPPCSPLRTRSSTTRSSPGMKKGPHRAAPESACYRRFALLVCIDDVAAPVLRPSLLVVPLGARLLLAPAHRLDARVGHPEQPQRLAHPVGAPLPKRQVVFPAAALVAVALDPHRRLRVIAQVARVRLDHRPVLGLDLGLVEVVVHAALGQDAVRVVQRISRHAARAHRAGLRLLPRPCGGLRPRLRLFLGLLTRAGAEQQNRRCDNQSSNFHRAPPVRDALIKIKRPAPPPRPGSAGRLYF